MGTGWGILQLILLLSLGVIARIRNFAANLSKNRWAQGFTFVFLLLIISTLLDLPLDFSTATMSRVAYGQSVQGWGTLGMGRSKKLPADIRLRRTSGDALVLGNPAQIAHTLVVLVLGPRDALRAPLCLLLHRC